MKRCLQNCLIKEDQANESALIADADRIFLPKSTLFAKEAYAVSTIVSIGILTKKYAC